MECMKKGIAFILAAVMCFGYSNAFATEPSSEEAEENYQETGKRSIIFVDRFDRLLNPKYNTKENIASIKEYMNTADEDFHSTIVFYTPEGYIESLDRGTIQPHRVGLTVKLPISDDDLNLE